MTNETPYKTRIVPVDIPEGLNIIFGQTHFIKTVEDLYETLVTSSMTLKFGIGFCEASQNPIPNLSVIDEVTSVS